jgi:hypothetical protein
MTPMTSVGLAEKHKDRPIDVRAKRAAQQEGSPMCALALNWLRERRLLCSSALGGLGYLVAVSASVAQTTSPPNFSSNQTGWLTFNVEFRPVPGAVTPVRNDPAHPRVSNAEAARTGKQPTFLISDLSHPNLKPWVVAQMKKDNAEVLDGKIAYTPHSSCTPAGVPAFHLYGFQPMYFIQTPKVVVMIFSGDKQVRRVYLNEPHSANPKPSWYGESVGHYEGDTLVVDTIGQNTKTFVDNFRTPHTDKLHVVERIRLVDGGKAMEVKVRVEDPDAFHEPWEGLQRYDRVEQPMQEEICVEGNRHLFEWEGMPVAKTPDF